MTRSREPSVQPRPTNAGQEVSFNQQGENMSKNKNSNRPKAKPKQLLLTLRIDEPLMDWLDEASIADRRTRSDYVRLLLEDARLLHTTDYTVNVAVPRVD